MYRSGIPSREERAGGERDQGFFAAVHSQITRPFSRSQQSSPGFPRLSPRQSDPSERGVIKRCPEADEHRVDEYQRREKTRFRESNTTTDTQACQTLQPGGKTIIPETTAKGMADSNQFALIKPICLSMGRFSDRDQRERGRKFSDPGDFGGEKVQQKVENVTRIIDSVALRIVRHAWRGPRLFTDKPRESDPVSR
ncbi:unnamed protein product [Mycena citricolor]|uniref:Uncharacterized protein n=1 Tax=Mycena citricolor TaxID=2018698 RepID=A0AAD2HM22_9AGAR|nr:unnamed protein product [Mycena citricolor]